MEKTHVEKENLWRTSLGIHMYDTYIELAQYEKVVADNYNNGAIFFQALDYLRKAQEIVDTGEVKRQIEDLESKCNKWTVSLSESKSHNLSKVNLVINTEI